MEKLSLRVEVESWVWEWLSGTGDERGGDRDGDYAMAAGQLKCL